MHVQQLNFFSFSKAPDKSLSHSVRKPTFAFISVVVLFRFPHDLITISVFQAQMFFFLFVVSWQKQKNNDNNLLFLLKDELG